MRACGLSGPQLHAEVRAGYGTECRILHVFLRLHVPVRGTGTLPRELREPTRGRQALLPQGTTPLSGAGTQSWDQETGLLPLPHRALRSLWGEGLAAIFLGPSRAQLGSAVGTQDGAREGRPRGLAPGLQRLAEVKVTCQPAVNRVSALGQGSQPGIRGGPARGGGGAVGRAGEPVLPPSPWKQPPP